MQERNPAGGFIAFTVGLVASLVLAVLFIVVADSTPQASSFPTAAPAAVAAAPTAAPETASGSGGGPGTPIVATEKEYAIALDKASVPAGPVTFTIKNAGTLPHNLGVVAADGASKAGGITGKTIKDSENIDGGKSGTLTVDLKPGTYQVVCTVPGHVQLGMIVMLTVT